MRSSRVGTPTERNPLENMALLVAAAALAVVVTVVLVLWEAHSDAESAAFISTPQFVLWLLLLCAQAAIWVGAAPFVAATMRKRYRDLRQRGALSKTSLFAIAGAVGTLLVLVVFSIGARRLDIYEDVATARIPNDDQWPLSGHQPKMFVLVGIGLVIGLAAVAAMWLTTIGFHELARTRRPSGTSVQHFLALRTELTTLLAVAGTLIGLATLSSGALREAVLAEEVRTAHREAAPACLSERLSDAESKPAEVHRRLVRVECGELAFDARYVVAYGLLFTGVLGLAFAPSFLAMRRAGERMRDRTFPLPRPHAPTFDDMVRRRAAFDALLETSLSATATFKAGVAIFTPLAASLVSTVLPT